MIIIGMLIAIAVIVLDKYQEKRGASFRLPVLAVAVGIYLPFELSVPIFIGGIIAWYVNRVLDKKKSIATDADQEELTEMGAKSSNRGLLFASGLITGEALIGILMAIPIVVSGNADVLALVQQPLGTWPGILLLLAVIFWLGKVAYPRRSED